MARSNGKSEPSKSAQKVRRLLESLDGKRSLLIVMQDNPDPDSIAAAAALRRLVNSHTDVVCSISHGGVVGRAENRALVEYLGLNFRPFDRVDPSKYDAVALVDTQPAAGNNRLGEDHVPDIVLDHHELRPATRKAPFTDVRSKYGAVSTILYEYLTEAGLIPEPPLATALLYGIRTDTQDLGLEAVQADKRALEALYPLANTRMLSSIQRGRVDTAYFKAIARGLEQARHVESSLWSALGPVDNADLIAELADMLLRHESAEWVLCWGIVEGQAWLSLRTAQTELTARDVMKGIVEGLGTGGGHAMSAGGQIPLKNGSKSERERTDKTIRTRFLERTTADPTRRPRRLIRRSAAE